jgi:NADPH2:quinone reductase
MKALIIDAYRPYAEQSVGEAPSPALKPGHVRVKMHAGGVNFPDILMIEGNYQIKPPFPFIAGAEGAGEVIELGEGVKHLKVGDRVATMPGVGTFAEEAVVPELTCAKIPDAMSFEEAAGFVMVYGTSIHALKDRGDLKPGDRLLVLGAAGGVGLATVELGKAMGAEVTAAASTDEKLKTCKDHGADHVINYSTDDLKALFKEAGGKAGFDVIYDPVGDKFAEPAFRSIAWMGRYLVIGFAAGDIPKLPLNLPLLKGADIRGVFWGAWTQRDFKGHQANMAELFKLYEDGKLKPRISASYPLADFAKAMDDLTNRRVRGKVVLTMSS